MTGTYIEPTFYTNITSKTGKTILKSSQKKRYVVSKEVAYILKQLLTEPVTRKKWYSNILFYFWN